VAGLRDEVAERQLFVLCGTRLPWIVVLLASWTTGTARRVLELLGRMGALEGGQRERQA